MRQAVLIAALIVASAVSAVAQGQLVPLIRAHAHNDYLHTRPLLDAIEHGFTSIEADIWLVNGELLVAHELPAARPERTLRGLYLDPLQRLVAQRGGRVYPDFAYPVVLLIDIKSDAVATYRALHEQLRPYEAMVGAVAASGMKSGPVLVVISGNRPRDYMLGQGVRYAGYDGRLSDLDGALPAVFMPLVSDNWTRHFAWMGAGPMPDDERQRLRQIVERAHARGYRLRFWSTPDSGPESEAVWLELLRAGVDLLNTDRLDTLREFLLRNDPKPSTRP